MTFEIGQNHLSREKGGDFLRVDTAETTTKRCSAPTKGAIMRERSCLGRRHLSMAPGNARTFTPELSGISSEVDVKGLTRRREQRTRAVWSRHIIQAATFFPDFFFFCGLFAPQSIALPHPPLLPHHR